MGMFVLVLTLWLHGIPHVQQINHLFADESECDVNGIWLLHQIKRKDWWSQQAPIRVEIECRELTRIPS